MEYSMYIAFGLCAGATVFGWSKKLYLIMIPAMFMTVGFKDVIDNTTMFTVLHSIIGIALKYLVLLLALIAAFEKEIKKFLIDRKTKKGK